MGKVLQRNERGGTIHTRMVNSGTHSQIRLTMVRKARIVVG